MSEIISLSPTMQRRMGFNHYLMDQADKKEAKDCKTEDEMITGHIWMVKDMVSRFRAHWPETRRLTDDLVSVGLEALTEFFRDDNLFDFNRVNSFIHDRMRDYINDNRSAFGASRAVNYRRQQKGEPLEYHFTIQLNDELVGEDDYSTKYVDILDAVERLAETDREDMHTLILHFLNHNHKIDEASLSNEERAAVERLSEIGRDLL